MNLKEKPFDLTDEQIAKIAETVASLTMEEKVGQLFCVMGGDFSPEQLKDIVAQGRCGGVLYRPTADGETIAKWFEPLDKAAKIPLLKAANLEEGGSGGRSDGTLFGWPMLTAATDDPDTAEMFGKVCGVEGAQCGINWTFSPVCDLNLNLQNPITNVRTFGSDQARVEEMTKRYVEGLEKQGVKACAKHFPGDGVDYRDQHLHPTVNSLSAEEWYASYGKIYTNLIEGGLSSIMVGHIAAPYVAKDANPDLTEEEMYMPATLSRTLLTDVLRGKLGFNGLITTDATIMAGFTTAMARCDALPAAIMAGADMLVFNTDFEEDYGYLLAAAQDGRLSAERLDEAVTRVLALKEITCNSGIVPEAVDGPSEHRKAADRSITLVKNLEPDVFPVTPERYPQILLIPLGIDNILDGSVTQLMKEALEKEGFEVEVYSEDADDMHGTASLSRSRLTLHVANMEHYSNQTTIRLQWVSKHALNVPRFPNEEPDIFVSLANPYHLQDVPRVRTYINAYTATKDVIELVVEKLMGKSEFKGVSPVDAFCGMPDTRL